MTGSGRASRKMSSASATEWLLPAGWRSVKGKRLRKKATLRPVCSLPQALRGGFSSSYSGHPDPGGV